MRTFLTVTAALLPGLLIINPGMASARTAITYQGQLQQSGAPFTGMADLPVTVYDSLVGGNSVAGPVQLAAVPVDFDLEFSVGL